MKKVIAVICIIAFMFSMVGCAKPAATAATGADSSSTAQKFELKLASHYPEGHNAVAGLKRIKERVEKETNGNVTITLYPGGQLGDYTQVYEEVMRGTIDMAHIAIPSQYDPKIEINFIPYLFQNYDQLAKVFSPGSYMYDAYTKIHGDLGVSLLGMYAEGFIGFGTKTLPTDLGNPLAAKKELIRVPPIDVYKLATEDMGYRTTTIPYADLFSALQTGVADGWIGGTPELNYLQFRDAIKYYIPYNVFVENTGYFINTKKLESMPAEYQKIIKDAVQAESQTSFKDAQANDEKYTKMLEDAGIKIVKLTPEELEAVAKNVREKTWPKLESKFGKDIMTGLLSDAK